MLAATGTGQLLWLGPALLLALVPIKDGPKVLRVLPLLLACALLAPQLSTDHHRYLWEGYVQLEGYSPYEHAPATLFERLDHPSETQINHPEYTAIYPPLAQALFLLTAVLGRTVYTWKLVLMLAFALFYLSRRARADALDWLCGPLLLWEGLWNAHLDALGVLGAWWLTQSIIEHKGRQAGVALGLLIALKLMPLLLLPACFMTLGRRHRMGFLLACGVTVLACFLPYISQWPHLFTSFRAFSDHWSFNNPLFHLLSALLPHQMVRPLLGLVLASGALGLAFWRAPIHEKLSATWILLLICSPTVYPWYLLWLLGFVPRGKRHLVQLAYAASCLSYLVLLDYRSKGIWQESLWWMIPEWTLLTWTFHTIIKKQPYKQTEKRSSTVEPR